jgi:pimeloyl-ACP methyl ester carboxylesterase
MLFGTPPGARATVLLLNDGRTLEGPFAQLAGVAESPLNPKITAGEVALTPLLVIDDGLRRTFIHSFYVRQVLDDSPERKVRIRLWQDVAEKGAGVGRIGQAIRITPFDEFGRRIYEMHGRDGPLTVVQGITEITPVYTKVEGLMGAPRPIVWDMRIATSSIPRDTLHEILKTAVPQDDAQARLEVVRLYLQSERYRDAQLELEQIVHDFPDLERLRGEVRQLRQLGARLILKEIQLRAKAGQHQLARTLLAQFPGEGVAGATLEQVRELLANYDAQDRRREAVLAELNAQVALIADVNSRRLAEQFAQEIAAEANANALGRLASFERLADAADLSTEQKVALAISGWLVGANQATDNFHVAVSLAAVRDKVREYLREPTAIERTRLAGEIGDLEGATVERVAQLLRLMKPPLDLPEDAQRGPGRFERTISGLSGHGDERYWVQLPPEYDPLRHYPVIVTLSDVGVAPADQLAFWTGQPRDEGEPLGQATRRGYITIAVDWHRPKQTTYDYSAREHHAVLGSLRDASRRFSIDTDRVFLSGHGVGGNAAWDVALAHPDLWAGVIPIVAVADRYCRRYGNNAEHLSWYVVAGELDGDKLAYNARELDRYLKPNSDATVVEYLGRGYEPFGDEIQRLFDWMGRRRRTIPKEFECVTMRPWDNFFWWQEVRDLPEKSMVAPATWPPSRGTRPFRIRAKLTEGNKVMVYNQAGQTTVWLGPELVNFDEPLEVELNGRRISPADRFVRPDLGVLLEDARARADRLHPFWAKIDAP